MNEQNHTLKNTDQQTLLQQNTELQQELRGQELLGRVMDIGHIALLGLNEYRVGRQLDAIPKHILRAENAVDRAGTTMEHKDHEIAYYGYLRETALTGKSTIEDRSSVRQTSVDKAGNPQYDLKPRPRSGAERIAEKHISKKTNDHAQAEAYKIMHHRNSGAYKLNPGLPSIREQKKEIKRQYKEGDINSNEREAKLAHASRTQPYKPGMLNKRYTKLMGLRTEAAVKEVEGAIPSERFINKLSSNQQKAIGKIQTNHASAEKVSAYKPVLEQQRTDIRNKKVEVQDRRQERKNAVKVPLFDRTRRASKAIVRGVSSVTVKALNKQAAYRQARRNRKSS